MNWLLIEHFSRQSVKTGVKKTIDMTWAARNNNFVF